LIIFSKSAGFLRVYGKGMLRSMKRYEIRIAGFGGQGVVTIGRVLGTAISMYEGKNSVNTQSYGPESRGGACRSEVVISDGEIYYPSVRKADVFIALSQVALDTYIADLKSGGVLIIDPGAVRSIPDRKDITVIEVPTMDIAQKVGGVKFQNVVALGALCTQLDWISYTSYEKAIAGSVPSKTIPANLEAFKSGRDYVKNRYEGKKKGLAF
jgi:2-oxoglutarate ferredoxin oxidoreductase subunit gamma